MNTIDEIPTLFPKTKQITIFWIKAVSSFTSLEISTPAFANAKIGMIK